MLILFKAFPLKINGNKLYFTYPDKNMCVSICKNSAFLHIEKKYGSLCFCSYFFRMPPFSLMLSRESAVHEPPIGELAPTVSHCCFLLVSFGTLIPVFLTLMVVVFVSVSANAMRPFPIAIMLTANTAAIAVIATSAVFWFFIIL